MKTTTKQSDKERVFPSTEIEKHLAEALQTVGSLACKVVGDVLLARKRLEGGSLSEVKLTTLEETAAVNAAVKVEMAAIAALARLMLDDQFRKLLRAEDARRMGEVRARRRTQPFAAAMAANPDASLKEIVRKLEKGGDVIDEGDYYRMGDIRIKKSSLPSKLSRLRRRQLRS